MTADSEFVSTLARPTKLHSPGKEAGSAKAAMDWFGTKTSQAGKARANQEKSNRAIVGRMLDNSHAPVNTIGCFANGL